MENNFWQIGLLKNHIYLFDFKSHIHTTVIYSSGMNKIKTKRKYKFTVGVNKNYYVCLPWTISNAINNMYNSLHYNVSKILLFNKVHPNS